MVHEGFPSKLLEKAVFEFSKLPGVGSKTALRFVLHLLRQETDEVERFGNSVMELKKSIKYCNICKNISDYDTCEICANPRRDNSTVCIVENIKDVMSIENTHQYTGLYHVLGGVISPMEGIGPDDLEIDSLVNRIAKGDIREVIFALRTTMEGDTTGFYIYKKISEFDVKLTALSRGVSIGGELEYTDEVTLGRSIVNRTDFTPTM